MTVGVWRSRGVGGIVGKNSKKGVEDLVIKKNEKGEPKVRNE